MNFKSIKKRVSNKVANPLPQQQEVPKTPIKTKINVLLSLLIIFFPVLVALTVVYFIVSRIFTSFDNIINKLYNLRMYRKISKK